MSSNEQFTLGAKLFAILKSSSTQNTREQGSL